MAGRCRAAGSATASLPDSPVSASACPRGAVFTAAARGRQHRRCHYTAPSRVQGQTGRQASAGTEVAAGKGLAMAPVPPSAARPAEGALSALLQRGAGPEGMRIPPRPSRSFSGCGGAQRASATGPPKPSAVGSAVSPWERLVCCPRPRGATGTIGRHRGAATGCPWPAAGRRASRSMKVVLGGHRQDPDVWSGRSCLRSPGADRVAGKGALTPPVQPMQGAFGAARPAPPPGRPSGAQRADPFRSVGRSGASGRPRRAARRAGAARPRPASRPRGWG